MSDLNVAFFEKLSLATPEKQLILPLHLQSTNTHLFSHLLISYVSQKTNSLKLELPDGISELEHSNITHIYWKNESINITTEDDVLCCISIHYVLCVGRFSSYLLNLAHFYHLNFNTSISFHLQFSWQTVKYNVFSNIFMRIPIVITGLRSLFSLE